MSENQITRISDKTVLPFLSQKESDMILLIGKDNLIRETSFAIQAVNANYYLAQATPESVAKCIWNNTLVGLTLNPIMKLACITPRKVNGQVEAIYMPQYQGLVKLITDTGAVTNIYAHPVYKGDIFEVQYGTTTEILHKPCFNTKVENITHFYAVGILKDGSKHFEVLTVEEVNAIRAKSDGYRAFETGKASSSIWNDHYSEMGRKTAIKRLTKYLPKSVHNEKWERVMNAIDIDNKDYPILPSQEEYLFQLIDTSSFDEVRKSDMLALVTNNMTIGDFQKMRDLLQQNQLDPINSGLPYNQTNIKKN